MKDSNVYETTRLLGLRSPPQGWRRGDVELVNNSEKAQAFMGSFFPSMAPVQEGVPAHAPTEIRWHPITEIEIYRSLRAVKGTTALAEDGLPTLI
jgi:hypothetical protein